ncbi:tyrosine-type recombinase/integrase [Kordiimonas lipolytica]|uniref:Tyrosine-type recombinase/integrase n=1 Tax=Kordiimonas lipolytica TaxID=1662421 RepID=A0ABV8UB01_9PROT|nr:tyrosine-type recombinase/integrase [Kordiimonas lipolytica]
MEKQQAGLFSAADEEAAVLMGWLPVQNALKAELDAVYARAQKLTKMARSENTRRAYRTAFTQYETWCRGVGVEPLSGDPGTVALYLSVLSQKVRPTTLKARLAAISVAHRLAGTKLDTSHEAIRLIMRGAAREKGLAPVRQARPLHYSILPALVDVFEATPLGIRNKALVLLGFAAALRRSEIAHIELKHINIGKDGLTLTLPRSKADRLGQGETIFVARHPTKRLCPVAAVEDWIEHRGKKAGALFLRANRNETFRDMGISEVTVNRVVKAAMKTLGVDESAYSGHSLRAGLATSAADAGCDLKAIMGQTRLRSAQQAMTYVRDSERRRASLTATLFAKSLSSY